MKHSISAVARMANLSPDVIRSWERRYKIVAPVRDASGVRMYSDEDVARLSLAREATKLGHPIRHVARLSDEQLEALVDRTGGGSSARGEAVDRLLEALTSDDLAKAADLLRSAALLLPARQLVLEVLAPALRETGRLWERGTVAIWQEHFLSTQIANVAGTLSFPADGRARMVLATPPFERHGFGVALAALLAASRGIAVCNLGVTVPAAELAAAARRTKAVAVVVGMTQNLTSEDEALAYARAVRSALPRGADLVLGGELGVRIATAMPAERVRGVATLEEFENLCPEWH